MTVRPQVCCDNYRRRDQELKIAPNTNITLPSHCPKHRPYIAFNTGLMLSLTLTTYCLQQWPHIDGFLCLQHLPNIVFNTGQSHKLPSTLVRATYCLQHWSHIAFNNGFTLPSTLRPNIAFNTGLILPFTSNILPLKLAS